MVYVSVSAKVDDVSVTGIDGNDQPLIVESTSTCSGECIASHDVHISPEKKLLFHLKKLCNRILYYLLGSGYD